MSTPNLTAELAVVTRLVQEAEAEVGLDNMREAMDLMMDAIVALIEQVRDLQERQDELVAAAEQRTPIGFTWS